MPSYIHYLETSVPVTQGNQRELLERLKSFHKNDRKTQAILHRIYTQSGIDRRHTVLNDYYSEDPHSFFHRCFNPEHLPSTGERNKQYESAAKELFLKTASALVQRHEKTDLPAISHVITVSCTGFFAPGPDYEIVKALGLASTVERYHIGFMGCYAAFPALRMAKAFCDQNPKAMILIVATELCSLHFNSKTDPDTLIAGSVFADGSAGALVSAIKPVRSAFQIEDFANDLAYEGEQDMAWTIGDTGFDMTLSSYVPNIIKDNMNAITDSLFSGFNLGIEDIGYWAIHPGGRAILDKVEQSFRLEDKALDASRTILRNNGNMSSATILFVLDELLKRPPSQAHTRKGRNITLAMAFGPGLSIETALLRRIEPS